MKNLTIAFSVITILMCGAIQTSLASGKTTGIANPFLECGKRWIEFTDTKRGKVALRKDTIWLVERPDKPNTPAKLGAKDMEFSLTRSLYEKIVKCLQSQK